jgi:two-component sensor histidine kinase
MAAYSLDEPLPSEVLHSAATVSSYKNYPVFSVPWFWRRTWIFAPIAAVIGAMQAGLVGAGVHNLGLGLATVGIGVPVWVLIVTVGPALATLVRHRRLLLRLERVGVVLSVAVGLATSFLAQYVANEFLRTVVMPHYHSPRSALLQQPPASDPFLLTLIVVWELGVFFSLGGGLALRSYFSEQARWRDAQRLQEIELLRRQKNESDMKLTVLQAQVEPHFLFNTLASVHSLVRSDPARAEATVEALVDHLRATLPKLRADIGIAQSTLSEQIELCQSYLAVMKVRMGSRLRYSVDVPALLRSHPFPPLMLISLVENAIKHGIEPSSAGGQIILRAAIESPAGTPQLAVSVIDDGVGLRPGAGSGVGLENLRAQIAARFETRGAFSIESRAGAGVEATIRVPCVEVRS